MRYYERKIYKYTSDTEEVCFTGLKGIFCNGYLNLAANGLLTISAGYSWDGPSGPTVDTKTFMRASLIHDALYQVIREGGLSMNDRKAADKVLRDACLKDGMARLRAWYVYQGVRLGGKSSCKPNIKVAP